MAAQREPTPSTGIRPKPEVPDHELVRCIGTGSFGEVWLARTQLGVWRAVKVIRRELFQDSRPYDREFAGMQRFEPLSREHEAFVDLLHSGQNAAGYFYYVMELADDAGPDADTASPDGPQPERFSCRQFSGF